MNTNDFLDKLVEIQKLLLALQNHPDWLDICNQALQYGEMTLGDALSAVDYATSEKCNSADEF